MAEKLANNVLPSVRFSQKFFLFQKPLAPSAPSERKADSPNYCVIKNNRMKIFIYGDEGHPLVADIDALSKYFMGDKKITLPDQFKLSSEGGSYAAEIEGGKLEFSIDLKAYSAELTWTKN